MAFHPEVVDRRRVVHADLGLLGIVPHPHSDVVVASVTPDVVRHLESSFIHTKTQFRQAILYVLQLEHQIIILIFSSFKQQK